MYDDDFVSEHRHIDDNEEWWEDAYDEYEDDYDWEDD